MAEFPNFVGGAYRSRSRHANAEALINFYVERMEVEGAKRRSALYPTPGLTEFCTLPKSPIRALFDADVGRTFAVAGLGASSGFYEIHGDGTFTDRGTVNNTGLPATIDSNGRLGSQLFIVSGDIGYCFDLNTNTLTQVVTDALAGAFISGFFLYLHGPTNAVRQSALNNGTSWNASHLFSRNRAGDPWITMKVINDLIWLLGPKTGEVWYNAGTAPVAMQPVPNGFFHVGSGSRHCIADVADAPVWLGRTKDGHAMIYRANGLQPQRISTHAVEFALQSYSSIADAVVYSYQEEGHTFFVLNLEAAGKTWVWDETTNLWHERGYWDTAMAQYQAGRPQYSCFSFGKHLVGDRASGTIYEMRVGLTTDADGTLIRRLRRTPHIWAEGGRGVFHKEIRFDMQTGDAPLVGQGSDPLTMLRWSDDHGETWSQERVLDVGKRGRYGYEVYTERLGLSPTGARTYELSMTDPLPWQIVGASIEAEAAVH